MAKRAPRASAVPAKAKRFPRSSRKIMTTAATLLRLLVGLAVCARSALALRRVDGRGIVSAHTRASSSSTTGPDSSGSPQRLRAEPEMVLSSSTTSPVSSWYDSGVRLPPAPQPEIWPMLGGTNKQYKVKSVSRTEWTPPAGWKPNKMPEPSPAASGSSAPTGPTAVTGQSWGLVPTKSAGAPSVSPLAAPLVSAATSEFPMLGGANKPNSYKVKSVSRTAWTPPAGWIKPSKSVSSWYDRGERLGRPSGPTAVTGQGWGLVPEAKPAAKPEAKSVSRVALGAIWPVKSWYDSGLRLAGEKKLATTAAARERLAAKAAAVKAVLDQQAAEYANSVKAEEARRAALTVQQREAEDRAIAEKRAADRERVEKVTNFIGDSFMFFTGAVAATADAAVKLAEEAAKERERLAAEKAAREKVEVESFLRGCITEDCLALDLPALDKAIKRASVEFKLDEEIIAAAQNASSSALVAQEAEKRRLAAEAEAAAKVAAATRALKDAMTGAPLSLNLVEVSAASRIAHNA